MALIVGVVWLVARPEARGPRRWLVAVTMFYAAATTSAVARIVSLPLVAGAIPLKAAPYASRIDTIVLLAAGSRTPAMSGGKISILNLAEAARVLEAARIYRSLGSPWIIASGGADAGVTTPEALVMRNALGTLDVPAERIVLEEASTTTHEQAINVATLLRARHVQQFILVTSDFHMPRALATFRAQGFDPIPARASYPLDTDPIWRSLIPHGQSLEFFSEIVHEYVGLAYYSARGWVRFVR